MRPHADESGPKAALKKSETGQRSSAAGKWPGTTQLLTLITCPRLRPFAGRGARSPKRIGATAAGALAVGAVACGALAIGVLVIGRLAVRRLRVGRSRIGSLKIGELEVGRLRVRKLEVMEQRSN